MRLLGKVKWAAMVRRAERIVERQCVDCGAQWRRVSRGLWVPSVRSDLECAPEHGTIEAVT